VEDWDDVAEYVYSNRNNFAGISFLSTSGDKDFNQAPNTEVIDAEKMVEKYGVASVLASGLVVDGLNAFGDLWMACSTAQGFGEDISAENSKNTLKKDWVRRFTAFADKYLEGDLKRTEYCLKDAHLIHRWEKIKRSYTQIDWISELSEKKYTDVDTLGAAACAGGACEIDF
jgi:ribonucleoside-diphosphate reductase alpha chain